VAFASASLTTPIESLIPVMNVQEVDSVLNMNDKQMMVMGGLLQDSTTSSQEGVPVASEVPIFGGLFRNQNDKVFKKEFVIFMKATILDEPEDGIHQTDKDLYRVFGQDRRPSKL
jgi:general secretion pathway protein D